MPEPIPYWNLHKTIERSRNKGVIFQGPEFIQKLDDLLSDAIDKQVIADVQVGAFLSGGIDSSLVASIMQKNSNRPIKTFTIGFDEKGYDEATYAKAIASHLGTDHVELYVSPQQAQNIIPSLPSVYDEPFADSSQIPTLLLSKLARSQVKVSLSGDGGDELFAGYTRYKLGSSVWAKLKWFPEPVRRTLAGVIEALPPSSWDKLFSRIAILNQGISGLSLPGDKMHKLADVLRAKDSEAVYRTLISQWRNPKDVMLAYRGSINAEPNLGTCANLNLNFIELMMYSDTLQYLPDDILTKVDRAAMSVGLETRIPFLDHRIIELAWQCPSSLKMQDGVGKWPLRELLSSYLPSNLIDRPKMGFGVPIDSWLRGPLREWAEACLSEKKLGERGYFKPKVIRQRWREHLSGKRNWQHSLWSILMFQTWIDSN